MAHYTAAETFTNDDDGLVAFLLLGDDGSYGYTAQDADSGETVGIVHGYKTRDAALAKIEEFLGGKVGGFAPAF